MKIAGIIAEYNPFHYGHKYHIDKTKEETGATHIVSVVSGDFVMRGEPALQDKLERAKRAVKGGCDLVVELPVCYALSSAEYFAFGGVSILDAMGCVDILSFGSESGETARLYEIANKLETKEIKERIKLEMKKGVPVFTAMSQALSEYKEIMEKPNNILGINYIKALTKLESKITPFTIKREGSGYNDETVSKGFASAKAIRNMLLENKDVSEWMPEPPFENPVFEKDFDKVMTYALRMADINKIKSVADVSEGLENLIKKAAFSENSIDAIASAVKSKRYAYTRIKRIMYNILLDIPEASRKKKPEYIRVLAFNEKGREILAVMKKKAALPIITNVTEKDFRDFSGIRESHIAASVYAAVSADKIKGLKAEIILK